MVSGGRDMARDGISEIYTWSVWFGADDIVWRGVCCLTWSWISSLSIEWLAEFGLGENGGSVRGLWALNFLAFRDAFHVIGRALLDVTRQAMNNAA